MYEQFSTPAALVDLDTVERNIKEMAEHCNKNGIRHRPHIKAHKSLFLAGKQQELGCRGITCAKVSEALVMARGGFDDILIAFPIIGQDKLELLAQVMELADTTTLVNSLEGARGLSGLGQRLGKPVRVLIEVDGGINRGGLKPGGPTLDFAREIKDLPGISIQGLLYYGGNIYGSKTDGDVVRMTRQERDDVVETAHLLEAEGFDMSWLSAGSSYSSRKAEHLQGITEVRAGNYIFNDNSSLAMGFVTEEDCALRVVSTVVSRPDAHTAIIDAGSKALTSDQGAYTKGFGHVVGFPGAEIYKLNEEHGFVRCDSGLDWKVGEKIAIVPNHACVIPNLNDAIYGVRGGKLERMIEIEARGKTL